MFSKLTIVFLIILTFSSNINSQVVSDTTNNSRDKTLNNRAPITYNINATLGGDNVLSSLKIEIIGDNLQIYRNIGTNNWSHQYYDWSDHPGRGIHLYNGGTYYYVDDNNTDIYVNGSPAGHNLSYFDGSTGVPYDRVDINIIDNYNATVKLTKTDVIEALLSIYYPAESDYINYAWHITNIGSSQITDLRFFEAGDTYSYGDDYGIGYWDEPTNTVGCQKEENGETVSVFLQSIETPFQHESANYGFSSGVESHVMNNALTGYVNYSSHDNAIALEWRQATLNPGETFTIHTIEKYSDKDITDLIVTAPFNEFIYAGTTKDFVFNVKNNSNDVVTDIELDKIIDLSGWTIDIIDPVGTFALDPDEEIDVTVRISCPVTEIEGTIAQATLSATANSETANDRAYIEVFSNMPRVEIQPLDQTVCSETDGVSFILKAGNTDNYQWQINNAGVWEDLSDGGVYSGTNTDTLIISDVFGIIGTEYKCMISNIYGEIPSDVVEILPDVNAPFPTVVNLPLVMDQCEATLIPPTATDNCLGIITATTNDTLFYDIQGTYEVTWLYEDGFGNSTTQTQTIIIDDTEFPIRDMAILPTLVGNCSFELTEFPTSHDNCAGTIYGTTTDPLTFDSSGVYNITWYYDDGNGNVTSQSQQVIIDDQEAPVPDSTSLHDIFVECELTSIDFPTATDGCDGTITATTDVSFPVNHSLSILWVFEDANGNAVTQNQNIIVNDQDAPIPDSTFLNDITGECEIDTIYPPTATDFCAGKIFGTADVSFPITNSTTVTWTYEDANENKITQNQNIIIDDQTPPIPDIQTLPTIVENCGAFVGYPSATDNCKGQFLASTTDTLFYDTDGTYTIHWKYEDFNGNITWQEQTIIIENYPPFVTTKNITIHILSNSDETITISPLDINNNSYDDCGIDSMYLDVTEFTSADEGENTVYLTVIDKNGNISTEPAIVTVVIDYNLEFPNLITPDGNGKNDYWVITGVQALEGYTLNIYNKLGELVYESDNYDNTWDATYNGKPLPEGTYYYVFSSPFQTYSGYVSVIR